MNHRNKTALRAAMLIHERQTASGQPFDGVYLPDSAWAAIHDLLRQITRARQRGWHAATARLIKDLDYALGNCRRYLDTAIQLLAEDGRPRQISTPADIYRDILALYDEVGDVEIHVAEHTLSVTTDAIVLEGISLGRFQVCLDWHWLDRSEPYRVVALDPNPAGSNDEVTHPHVQSGVLCEGEGRTAIRAAMQECRLLDFFVLVSQVLHTYARGSAFVELRDWDGMPCTACGDRISEDGRYYCHRCDSTLCDSCVTSCQGCDESYCSDCLSHCAACDGQFCSSCLECCPVCRQPYCDDCREAGMCRSCYEKQQHEKERTDDLPRPALDPVPAGKKTAACL